MHECSHCGCHFDGRKRKYCSDECAAQAKRHRDARNKAKARRSKGIQPRASKPSGYYRTPEYKRIQRFRQARREGRVPKHRPLPAVRAIHRAHQARVKAWKRYLRACDRLDRRANAMTPAEKWRWRYRHDPEFRAKQQARLRAKKYRRRLQKKASDDGTVGPECYGTRPRCLYCDTRLTNQSRPLDHMVPLDLGGMHSASNVTECCLSCNSRKGNRAFDDWLAQLSEPHRTRAEREYVRKQGASPRQLTLTHAAR